jgi:hypothetical protein
MRFHRALTTLTLTCALAAALPAAAQTKKVTVGGRPAPGQTVRLNIVQDADLNMKPAESAAGSPMGPMHLTAKTTTVVSQKVGTPDEKGGIKVDMTYEEITQDMKMNDSPAPPEAAAAALAMKGKTLSMTIDAAGEVIDVTPPADFPMPTAIIKDMLKQALGLMPRQELSVGETVTAPFAMAMPLPMPGNDPPQLKGELKSTLTGVTGAPGSEVAALKMAVKGTGTTNWDVKGALVQGSKMTTEISGTFTVPGVGPVEMSGTTIVSLERIP